MRSDLQIVEFLQPKAVESSRAETTDSTQSVAPPREEPQRLLPWRANGLRSVSGRRVSEESLNDVRLPLATLEV